METLRWVLMYWVDEEVPAETTLKSGKEGSSGGGVFWVPLITMERSLNRCSRKKECSWCQGPGALFCPGFVG